MNFSLNPGTKSKHHKKKPRTDLFTGDGLNKPGSSSGGSPAAGAAAGGGGGGGSAKGPKAKPRLSAVDKTALNRIKRGGKGKKAFKSQKRHKRR